MQNIQQNTTNIMQNGTKWKSWFGGCFEVLALVYVYWLPI